VALDYDEEAKARHLVEQLDPGICRLKVGKEMFTRFGPAWVEWLQARGFDVFLDLKFHDIPNTVAKAVRAAADLGVWMVNVHASGGSVMMRAAREALAAVNRPPLLIAVTVLTSMTPADLEAIGITCSLEDEVRRLAALAAGAGMDGVVCSAREAAMLKQHLGPDVCLVTPGIRPAWSESDDQKRIMTPAEARRLGSDFLVVGRPITQAADPGRALERIVQELKEDAPEGNCRASHHGRDRS
jgi:orotidine-5'-phosphate decarboxylase